MITLTPYDNIRPPHDNIDPTWVGKQKISNSKIFQKKFQPDPTIVVAWFTWPDFWEDTWGINKIWIQARTFWDVEGIDPISNYEVVSIGLGDLLTPKVWQCIHSPKARVWQWPS